MILFDEIEKAHPDVFNVLLQLLDDGRLTDGQGRTVDFRNTVVIMTSNIGSQFIQDMGLMDPAGMKKRVMEAVQNHFRPEFLNRIDEIIVFQSLSVDQIKRIVDIQLNILSKRLSDKKLGLTVTESAEHALALAGYDPVYGARPLKRAIQKLILDPLSRRLLAGEFKEGDHIVVDADDKENLQFSRQE